LCPGHDGVRSVINVEELPGRIARSPGVDRVIAAFGGRQALADESGYDVRRLKVEVVPRTVEVDRDQVDAREPELLTVCLQLDQQRLLGDPVRGVRFLRVALPQVLFAERDRRELG